MKNIKSNYSNIHPCMQHLIYVYIILFHLTNFLLLLLGERFFSSSGYQVVDVEGIGVRGDEGQWWEEKRLRAEALLTVRKPEVQVKLSWHGHNPHN